MGVGAYLPPGVHPFGSKIRAIQTVLLTQNTGVATSTLAFANLTNADKCIPFLSGRASNQDSYSAGDPGEISRTIDIYSATGVKADVNRDAGATGSSNHLLAVTLLEFPIDVTVAKYTLNTQVIGASDYIDATITAVDTSKSFIVCTGQRLDDDGSGGIRGQTGGFCARFTSSTNVRIHCVNNPGAVPKLVFYVVTDLTGNCFTVTSTYTTIAGATRSANITVPAHVQAKTLAIVNWHANGGSASYPNVTFIGKHTWSCYPSSNTNFVMNCHSPNPGPYVAQVNIQLITFSSGVSIQHARITPIGTNYLTNLTITSVDTSKSAAVGYLSHHFDNARIAADTAGCPPGAGAWRVRLSSATNVESVRYDPGTAADVGAADLGIQVISTS